MFHGSYRIYKLDAVGNRTYVSEGGDVTPPTILAGLAEVSERGPLHMEMTTLPMARPEA